MYLKKPKASQEGGFPLFTNESSAKYIPRINENNLPFAERNQTHL